MVADDKTETLNEHRDGSSIGEVLTLVLPGRIKIIAIVFAIPPATGMDIDLVLNSTQQAAIRKHCHIKQVCCFCGGNNQPKKFLNPTPGFVYDFNTYTQTLQTFHTLCDLCVYASYCGVNTEDSDDIWIPHAMHVNGLSRKMLRETVSRTVDKHEHMSEIIWKPAISNEIMAIVGEL